MNFLDANFANDRELGRTKDFFNKEGRMDRVFWRGWYALELDWGMG